jgi:activator of HSP90 ATPase
MESLRITKTFPASREQVYLAWLDSKTHSRMTGSKAIVTARVNGKFSAWDGYISGATIALQPNRKIVQSWRTADFPETSPDSILEIRLAEVRTGTRLTLVHKNIPDEQSAGYKQGWKDYYFKPMMMYFSKMK